MGVSPMAFETIVYTSSTTPASLLVYGRDGDVSCLGSHDEIEPRDVRAPGDGQLILPRCCPVDTVVGARGAKDFHYSARLVAEVIARIVGAVDAVEDATPVRMDQPSQKQARESSCGFALPRQQLDLPLVFPAGPVLRE